jgi:hypothetical protein
MIKNINYLYRSRPYSFGLGKRSADEDSSGEELGSDEQTLADLFDQYEDSPGKQYIHTNIPLTLYPRRVEEASQILQVANVLPKLL